MNAIRGTLWLWVVIALIGWTIGVGLRLVFPRATVGQIWTQCARQDPSSGVCVEWIVRQAPNPDWSAIWVVGCLAILAFGFLTRRRSNVIGFRHNLDKTGRESVWVALGWVALGIALGAVLVVGPR